MPSYRPPAGFYQAPDTNYPDRQSAIGGIVDEMGLPNGVGSNMMGDPYSDAEIASAGKSPLMRAPGVPLAPLRPAAPSASGRTVLTPSRTSPFSRADAQALAALDPRSLAEAKGIAAMPESTPAKMTGSFGGQSFEMQPSARVDRNALARLYAQGVERKGQERQDAVRGQVQTGAESLARIPVEGAIGLAKQQGGDKLAAINAEGAIQAPTRAANVRKSDAEVAALGGTERRAQGTFDKANDPAELGRKAADDTIRMLVESGLDKTPQGRQTIAALRGLSSAGSRLPENVRAQVADASTQTSPADELAAVQEFTADPQVAKLLASIQSNKPGIFGSSERPAKQAADRQALDSYIAQYARAKGIDPAALRVQIESQLVGSKGGNSVNLAGLAGAIPGMGGAIASQALVR